MTHADVIIVGGGHRGAQAALALRPQHFEGPILLIGRERETPYERPPLSREYLAREKTFERLYIRSPQFWADKQVEMRLVDNRSTPDAARLGDAGVLLKEVTAMASVTS